MGVHMMQLKELSKTRTLPFDDVFFDELFQNPVKECGALREKLPLTDELLDQIILKKYRAHHYHHKCRNCNYEWDDSRAYEISCCTEGCTSESFEDYVVLYE